VNKTYPNSQKEKITVGWDFIDAPFFSAGFKGKASRGSAPHMHPKGIKGLRLRRPNTGQVIEVNGAAGQN
jgi:hypothetical protein